MRPERANSRDRQRCVVLLRHPSLINRGPAEAADVLEVRVRPQRGGLADALAYQLGVEAGAEQLGVCAGQPIQMRAERSQPAAARAGLADARGQAAELFEVVVRRWIDAQYGEDGEHGQSQADRDDGRQLQPVSSFFRSLVLTHGAPRKSSK